jgi:hypothetical protein
MGNWSNVRLVVIGTRTEVETFAKIAGRTDGRIRRPKPPVWEPWMEFGECADLEADGFQHRRSLSRIDYRFQTKSPDVLTHFRGVSRRFPKLHFILGWGDPELTDIYSDYVRAGRARHYTVPERTRNEVRRRHLRDWGATGEGIDEDDEDEEFWADVDAEWELIGVVVARWEKEVGWG